MLKGDAKTEYQREYMRRRRAEQRVGKSAKPKAKPQENPQPSASRDAEVEALRDQVIALKSTLQGWSQFMQDTRKEGLMSPETFKLILSCLHPDSRKSLSDKKLSDAFRVFGRLRFPLTGKGEEMKKAAHHFTAQEWEWVRQRKRSAARAAKRTTKAGPKAPSRRELT